MASSHSTISPEARTFIERQRMFFVATAPLRGDGHINLSPKGLDSFRVLDERTVAYLDHVGSGAETIAHLRENGRIVIMFCAFDGPPKILRIHGRGEVIEPQDHSFAPLRDRFGEGPRGRAILRVEVARVAISCGYGVPLFRFEGDRSELDEWCERKGPDGLDAYQRQKNATSLDGLPALRWVGDGNA